MSHVWMDGFDHGSITKWTPTLGYSTASKRNGLAAGQPGVTVCKRPIPAALQHATMILGFALERRVAPAVSFWGDNGINQLVTVVFADDGKVRFYRGTAAGTLLGLLDDTTYFPTGVFHYLSVKLTLSQTVGKISCQYDGLPVPITYAAGGEPVFELVDLDTNPVTSTVIDSIGIIGSSGQINRYDDMYLNNGAGSINNDFWPPIRVETLMPNAAGTYSQFVCSTGTNHQALVDESPMNTTDWNASDVPGNIDCYGLSDLASTSVQVLGVNVTNYMMRSDSNPRTAANMMRTGTTDVIGATQAITTTYQTYTDVYELNPVTGVAWTPAEINALQAGAKVIT